MNKFTAKRIKNLIVACWLQIVESRLGVEKAVIAHQSMLQSDTFEGGIDFVKIQKDAESFFPKKRILFSDLEEDEQHLVVLLYDLFVLENSPKNVVRQFANVSTLQKVEILQCLNPITFLDFLNAKAEIEGIIWIEYFGLTTYKK